jgi:hypothetical protein
MFLSQGRPLERARDGYAGLGAAVGNRASREPAATPRLARWPARPPPDESPLSHPALQGSTGSVWFQGCAASGTGAGGARTRPVCIMLGSAAPCGVLHGRSVKWVQGRTRGARVAAWGVRVSLGHLSLTPRMPRESRYFTPPPSTYFTPPQHHSTPASLRQSQAPAALRQQSKTRTRPPHWEAASSVAHAPPSTAPHAATGRARLPWPARRDWPRPPVLARRAQLLRDPGRPANRHSQAGQGGVPQEGAQPPPRREQGGGCCCAMAGSPQPSLLSPSTPRLCTTSGTTLRPSPLQPPPPLHHLPLLHPLHTRTHALSVRSRTPSSGSWRPRRRLRR